ncbi:MAG: 8-oxo-dGTP diphosphatase [SAR324 cluster bacterium]|nr:8-oxo-dGTP diphosphatase [SAR324 cluster bacterium]
MKLGVLVYIENNGEVLMIHRQKNDEHRGLWLAPGGKLHENESPMEAAMREVYEETGLRVQALQLKGILTFPDDGDSPFGDEWQVFVFYTNHISGKLTINCPEGKLAWIPREELLDLPMWEGDKLFTPKVFKNECFSGKLHYKAETLVEKTFWP